MIDGISISGYRSFGSSEVRIGDLAKINIFIGKNNCGKSNILRFLDLLSQMNRPRRSNVPSVQLDSLLDFSLGSASKSIVFGYQLKKSSYTAELFKTVTEQFGSNWSKLFPEYSDSFWLHFLVNQTLDATQDSLSNYRDLILKRCSQQETNALTSVLRNYTGGSPEQRAADISAVLHSMVKPSFPVHLIGAFRRISDAGDDVLSGNGLIKELRKLQSPELANYNQGKQRFSQIVQFVRAILGEPNAELEIPAEKDEVYVTIGKKVLPLDSLGTGIHELIIMASAVTLIDGALFCIEEPEIHLHPELQKKFIHYIVKNTHNQYFIASHSSAFFDLPGVNIYRCELKDEYTDCQLVSSAADKHAILMDLGYRPSDLLQANYIIWVEGPSDRIYIKHWIKAKAPELVEGLHYAIMFYGGRLLSHLSFDDPMVEDFIRLSCLNRNACIVIDSDRKTAHSHLNSTKRRIISDFNASSCLTWVTSGRTIENYVSEELLNSAIKDVHTKSLAQMKWERFADLTHLRPDKPIDKVAVARAVVNKPSNLTVLDLNQATDDLVCAIKKHNV